MRKSLLNATIAFVLLAFAAVTVSAQPGIELGIKGGLGMASLSDENVGFVSLIRSADFPVDYRDTYEAKSLSGFQIGGFATFNLSSSFALQPEFIYCKKGGKVQGDGILSDMGTTSTYAVDEQIELTYLEIPILVKFKIPTQGKLQPTIFAGPALALNLSAKSDFELTIIRDDGGPIDSETLGGKADISNNKSTDIGLVFGGDLKLKAGSANFVLDVRYTLGTSKLFEDVHPDEIPEFDFDGPWPSDFPNAHWETGVAPDMKSRVFSIMLGVSVPM